MAKQNVDTVIFNAKPAENGWRDASVVGNGRVWGMVKGAYGCEEILLTQRDMGQGGHTSVLQDVSDKFSAVARLYDEGNIVEAEKVLSNQFAKQGYKPKPDMPYFLPRIMLKYDFDGFVTNYSRATDMESGEVEVAFKHGNGAARRTCFVARPRNGKEVYESDVFAYEATDTAGMNATIFLADLIPARLKQVVTFGDGGICCSLSVHDDRTYGFVARVVNYGGTVKYLADRVVISGAEGFAIYIKTFNDKLFSDASRDGELKKKKAELGLVKSYDKLLAPSANAHAKLFNSFSLSLGGADNGFEMGGLVSNVFAGNLSAGLVTRLWNLGKYNLICGTTGANMTFFNAYQLLYCGSMADIIQDVVLEFFGRYENFPRDLRDNAKRAYGCEGYCVPNVISPQSALFGSVDSATLHFVASSALAGCLFYRHYLATADVKTLKSRILPFMKNVCSFYQNFLKRDDASGFYKTIPSFSPNSTPGNTIMGKPLENFAFATNSTIDFLAIECLIDSLIAASTVCGNRDDIAMLQDMKTKIPPYTVGSNGALREYTQSAFIDRANNHGTMQAYGLWPLKNLSFSNKTVTYQPAVAVGAQSREQVISLRDASANAVLVRLNASWGLQDARSIAIAALQMAHAGQGGAAAVRDILLRLVVSCFSQSGLSCATDWRGSGFTKNGAGEFDVCGNVGFMNAITECIVQSNANTLRILPCTFDVLQSGRLCDVMTDFSASVTIEWDLKKGKLVVKILPKVSCVIAIELPRGFKKVKSKEAVDLTKVKLTAGRAVALEIV